ncbi:MAG: RagB/SusD family nutrient uptake outer membrane protein [Tannerellaceae bacterium]|jgi:hypothetical protein|nr:RagB/SusD family nutrient uptake outer membrane protein [Tannerellaceae bacterium]
MKQIVIIIASLTLLAASACSDFLDEKSPNDIVEENFWTTENDLFLGITAAYSTLTQNYMYGTFEYEWVPLVFRTDEMESLSPWTNWPEMMTFRLDNTPYEINRFWYLQYTLIARSHQVIEAAGRMTGIDESVKNHYIAEGRFLRSFAYLRLLQNFRYPVLIEKFSQTEDDFYNKQPEREVIFKLIEDDLSFAKQHLPKYNGSNADGRALAGAAAAFLGKACLYQQKYREAAAELEALVRGDYGPYGLLPNFDDNFNGKNENSRECLFQSQFGASNLNARTTHSVGISYGSWEEAWPAQWLFDEMSKELDQDGNYDLRLFGTLYCNVENSMHPEYTDSYREHFADVIAESEQKGGSPLFTDKDGKVVYFNKMQGVKYAQSPEDMADGWRNTTNINYMRYADVLLMLAEALNESGETTAATAYLNQVRERANMTPLPATLSKEALREKIMRERVLELSFEMDRYCDLTRWDAAGLIDMKEVLASHNKLGINNFQKGKHEYLPIPLDEITNNKHIDPTKVW